MIRRSAVCSGLVLVLTLALYAPAFAQADPPARRAFLSGYAGTVPSSPKDLAKTYFNQPQVRRLIYALSAGPLAADEASSRLAGADATLDDLVRLKLIRRDGGQVRLAFAYFDAADVRLIHAAAARYAPRLVAAYRAKAGAFAAIWAKYPVASVGRGQLAFVMISGVGLNWDGLDILLDGGWRKPRLVTGPGWRYSFFASEDTPDYSYAGYYWGSSAFPGNLPDVAPMPLDFVSFGDTDSDPRMNLPDLMGLTASDMTPPVRAAAERLGMPGDPLTGPNTMGVEAGRRIGALLLRLRSHAATVADLQAGLPQDRVADELRLLEACGYVRAAKDGRYELTAPVFADADKPMFDAARALNKAIIRQWVAANYAPIRHDLAGLSALRQGVPYEVLFTQIWHELFGAATRDLVKAGLTADPRAPGMASPGSMAMAWQPELLQREWQ